MKIYCTIKHNCNKLTFAGVSSVIVRASASVLSVVLANAPMLTRISPADSTLCNVNKTGIALIPFYFVITNTNNLFFNPYNFTRYVHIWPFQVNLCFVWWWGPR